MNTQEAVFILCYYEKMIYKKSIFIFWIVIVAAIAVVAMFAVPYINELLQGPVFLVPPIILFLTGVALLFSVRREKIEGRLKKSLLITGFSAVGFFASIFLHNFFYAIGTVTEGVFIVHQLFEVLHGLFFLIAIPVCPVTFLAGALWTIIILWKGEGS